MIKDILYYTFGSACLLFCFAAMWTLLAMLEALMQ